MFDEDRNSRARAEASMHLLGLWRAHQSDVVGGGTQRTVAHGIRQHLTRRRRVALRL